MDRLEQKIERDWLSIDDGISAVRLQMDQSSTIELDAQLRDMLWVTVCSGTVNCNSPVDKRPKQLGTYDSAIFAWPRSPWKLVMQTDEDAEVSVCRITLEALHRMLAVEFAQNANASSSMDMKQLSRVVHFSPLRIRDMGRLFIHSHKSRFKAISRRGIFFDLFAEMMELLYGRDMSLCPFQIDSDTERKIRNARQLLVSELHETPDFMQISRDVDLPPQVLKEGFSFIYGKEMSSYLNDYKFEEARIMLESGKFLIKEVAFKMGYQNPSHFISSFKQRYGTTPKQWVKALS
jgi:AraC-like DNA-binding protein